MPALAIAELLPATLRKRIDAARSRVLSGAGAALILLTLYILRLLRRRSSDQQRRRLEGGRDWGARSSNRQGSRWGRQKGEAIAGSANRGGWTGHWNDKNRILSGPVQEKADAKAPLCWLCKKPAPSTGPQSAWGNKEHHVNVRVRCCTGRSPRICHFQCIRGELRSSNESANTHPEIDPQFEMELRELLTDFYHSPNKAPQIQYNYEEMQLLAAGKQASWPLPDPPAPPSAVFALDGLVELRVSDCPLFKTVPPEVGSIRGLRMLVFISTGITELPVEVGELKELHSLYLNGNFLQSLPNAVGTLPALQEICLDANQLEVLPPITSPELTLFSAPANRLKELPVVAGGKLERMELHGNRLSYVPLNRTIVAQVSWTKMLKLKLMGNCIQELPREIGYMRSLRHLMVASNCLRALPKCVASLRRLEWLFAYNNQITDLPPGLLLASGWLERVLLEGNPLGVACVADLINDVPRSCVKTLGLDAAQIRDCEQGVTGWEVLPPVISVGSMVQAAAARHYYMRLTRASQLRRQEGVPALGEPGGPTLPDDAPARLLIVAFAASQGEPEWLGVLQRLSTAGRVSAQSPVIGSLEELWGTSVTGDDRVSALWSGCSRKSTTSLNETFEAPSAPLEDFDVLSVVDHRMRWYAEDIDVFSRALETVAKPYECVVFVGASMGGFGALLHCAHIANAVVVFGPQALLSTATLRPPALSRDAHDALRERMLDSVRTAQARGASVELHCASDEHLGHALSVPLEDLALTVHPLSPRKPFAKLLERVGLLTQIVSEVLYRRLTPTGASEAGDLGLPQVKAEHHPSSPRIAVARWMQIGPGKCRMERHWTVKTDLLKFIFNRARMMPRPGDWFCPLCARRCQSYYFYCPSCKDAPVRPLLSDFETIRIPDGAGRHFPQTGDWGCGRCANALCNYQASCTHCHASRDDPSNIFAT